MFNGTLLLMLGCAGLFAQGVPAPFIRQTYFNSNGQPLAGGSVCSFTSGTSSPVATFSSYLLSNANPVCVPLDASGRASIWLDPAIVYRFVLKSSTGVTIWTEDGIAVAAAGGAGGQTWAVSGSTIYNPGVGTKVCIGQNGNCTTALALLNVQGTSSGNNYLVRIDDAGNSPGINLFASGNSVGSYAGDSGGLRLRAADGTSQMTVAAGAVTIQNVGGGATNLLIKGGSAQGSTNFLTVQNNAGSALAYIDSAGRYLGTLYNAAPATGTDYGFQLANSNFLVNGNGDLTSNGSINATGADGLDPYKVNGTTMVDAAGNATFTTVTCTSSPCGSGGGGGGGSPVGITNSIQVKASGTTFGGDANFTYTTGTGIVQLLGAGYLTSHGGLLSDGTAPNIIQAPNGGLAGKWLTATDSLFLIEEGAPAVSASGQSRFYMDSTSHKAMVSQNNGAFANLATNAGALTNGHCVSIDGSGNFVDAGGACTTGGGGGTVSSATVKSLAYYTATGTTVGGSTNFTWDNATQQIAITSTSVAVPAITVTSGYIAADGGFVTTSASTSAIQAPNGQIAGKTLFASDSLIFSEEVAPALSGAGQSRIYMNSSSHSLLVSVNGSTYVPFGAGGSGVSSITGTGNQVNVNTPTGAVILSLPQNIDTAAAVNFGTINTSGVIQSGATGGGLAFKTANNLLSMDGSGNISAAGQINLSGGGASNQFKIGGTTVIDSGRNAIFQNLLILGTCTGCGGGGGGGVTSAAGTGNQVLVNGGTGAATGAITLSLPQGIGTSSTPTFAGVIAGAFSATGGGITIQNANFTFQVDSTGNISAANQLNLTGAGSVYKMGGATVINNGGAFVGNGVDVGSHGISAGNFNTFGGGIGQTWNVSIPGMSISGTGCTSGLIFRGGILISCF